jgi:hypothetical protein
MKRLILKRFCKTSRLVSFQPVDETGSEILSHGQLHKQGMARSRDDDVISLHEMPEGERMK